MRWKTLPAAIATLLGLAAMAQAQTTDPLAECVLDEGAVDRALANQERTLDRLEQLCGSDTECADRWRPFEDMALAIPELLSLQTEYCGLVAQHTTLGDMLPAVDELGESVEVDHCTASSLSWCEGSTSGSSICPIDLIGPEPFAWPEDEPLVVCPELESALGFIAQPLTRILLPHNPRIYGDPSLPDNTLFHDVESPYGQYFDTRGEADVVQIELVAMHLSSLAPILVSGPDLDGLALPGSEVSPGDILDELDLPPDLITPFAPGDPSPLPAHPHDRDCDRIRDDVARKQAEVDAIDCSDLEAAYLAAQADADAAADALADAQNALDGAQDTLVDAVDAWETAKSDLEAAAQAITDLVDDTIHHSGISTDGAGGEHHNYIGSSHAGIGFKIYFDGSESSINTILWFFNTQAYKDARRAFRAAARAMAAAEEAKNAAANAWLTALLDYLDALDAYSRAQAIADAALEALELCQARKAEAEEALRNCQRMLDECLGRQSADTDEAQREAEEAIEEAEGHIETAEGYGADGSDGREALGGARGLLGGSEEAEAEGRQDDAQALAEEATRIAREEAERWEAEAEARRECCEEADRLIREASDAIRDAEQELAEADNQGAVDTSAAHAALDQARRDLEEAERLRRELRCEEAKPLARRAAGTASEIAAEWADENAFWSRHRPCDPEGASMEELVSEYCDWPEDEPHLVPRGHTPTSYRALDAVRKLIAVIGYAITGSDPVNDTVDAIVALASTGKLRELYVFYYGTYVRDYTMNVCVTDDQGHQYWEARSSRTERGDLDECGFHLTSELDEILALARRGDRIGVEAAVLELVGQCRPVGCDCVRPPGC